MKQLQQSHLSGTRLSDDKLLGLSGVWRVFLDCDGLVRCRRICHVCEDLGLVASARSLTYHPFAVDRLKIVTATENSSLACGIWSSMCYRYAEISGTAFEQLQVTPCLKSRRHQSTTTTHGNNDQDCYCFQSRSPSSDHIHRCLLYTISFLVSLSHLFAW